MIADYVHLSFTFLRNRKLRSWLTVVGIFIGITSVVSLISLGEGLRQVVISQFNLLSTDVLTVTASGLNFGVPGQGAVKPLQTSYVDDIERLVGVEMAMGRNLESTKVEFNGYADFIFASSLPRGEKRKEFARIVQIGVDKGRMLRDTDGKNVVLGSDYSAPDRFGKAVRTGDVVFIKGEPFGVVGLLQKKGSFIVDHAVLMNENILENLFGTNKTYDVILAVASPGADMESMKERIEAYLRDERDVKRGEEDFSVESPQQRIKDLGAILLAIQVFLYVIAGISLVVGGIGIANTMYTSVVERTKQIGIMKSIGAHHRNIFTLFLIESGFLGLLGGFLGLLAGTGLAFGVSLAARQALGTDLIQVSVPWALLVGALVFSFLIGSIAGIMPALQAAKLKPVDALQVTT